MTPGRRGPSPAVAGTRGGSGTDALAASPAPLQRHARRAEPSGAPAPARGRSGTRRPVVIDGRFLAQPLTGVQRYARELVRALDGRLAAGDDGLGPVSLVRPPDAPPLGGLSAIDERAAGVRAGHAWEQIDLARAARGARLVCLGNAAPLAHPRVVVALHDAGVYAIPDSYGLAFRLAYRAQFAWFARRAERIVTVSSFSASELARHAGVDPARTAVVPNGASHLAAVAPDRSVLARRGLAPGGYVLAIGSPKRHKNLAAVAAALSLLPEPRPRLAVAGNVNPRGLAAAQAPDDAVLLGGVSEGELKALYAHALCLAFPSFYEGFGIPPLEAMACGCPAVVARTSSLPEVCGDAALYCDPRDPATLADAIGRLRDEPGLRADLAARGRARAALFTWDAAAGRLLGVLAELAAEDGP